MGIQKKMEESPDEHVVRRQLAHTRIQSLLYKRIQRPTETLLYYRDYLLIGKLANVARRKWMQFLESTVASSLLPT